MDHDDEIEIDGARLIYKKRVWVPSGRSVSFVAKSLHISCRQNVLATDGKLSTSINGDIYVDILGILVIGLHDKGRHQLALNIDAADDNWLNKPISDLDSGVDGRLTAPANLHHFAGDP